MKNTYQATLTLGSLALVELRLRAIYHFVDRQITDAATITNDYSGGCMQKR